MKSYEIWLKGGGSMVGKIKEFDAEVLAANIGSNRTLTYQDGDGDTVVLCLSEVAAFVYRDEEPEKGIGYT